MSPSQRPDGRANDQLRPLTIETGFQKFAEGSALIKSGDTWVLCAASVQESVPPFIEGKGTGWVTAEYAMLPRSTHTRTRRDPGGRGKEIQRLIGRALRAAVDNAALGPRTIAVDCDVLQADGGTRVRVDHRRLGGGGAGDRAAGRGRHPAGRRQGAARAGGRGLGRHHRRRGAARPALRRGLAGRGRHERGHDPRRQADRGPGHRRGRVLQPGPARRHARSGRRGIAQLCAAQDKALGR